MGKRKLILKCGLSPGDIIMLTAAVRDLHWHYPDQFLTDVRTPCPELWENNPHLTRLSDADPETETIDCRYPLIDRCNYEPYHCLHGFIEFFNGRLDLSIQPTVFKGDIHLSPLEKKWSSQVHELTGRDTPFWIVAAGGKYDVTIKWWETRRYQEVVDRFRGKIQLVQVGNHGHHHPRLEGVVDLRGKTNLRQLVRLVHHAQGVLCSVTALMHLAAAVETKRGQPKNRPCVVIAGGREPAHWEAYPDHQFIHTNGALRCCSNGGCWKDRITPLRDGDERDGKNHLCVDVIKGLPHCMDMIKADDVIGRIETYFQGGIIRYLSSSERTSAAQGVIATANNDYDRQPLTLQSAGTACDEFISTIPPYPDHFQGRGIVICGGGISYFTNAWVCINMLRRSGCKLPIELWHLDKYEMDDEMRALVAPLGVKCVNAEEIRKRFPVRFLNGWELKPFAILNSSFREVMLLDADNVPVMNPEFLFGTSEFKRTGAIFWPDFGEGIAKKALPIWKSCGIRVPKEREFESGQIVLDKKRCWQALRLSLWFNENSDFYYRYIYGDKETFHLAFRKLKKSYALVPTPLQALEKTMCQHDFDGRRIFQHRNCDKWDLFLRNRKVEDFWFEQECREYLAALHRVWSGMIATSKIKTFSKSLFHGQSRKTPKLEMILVSTSGQKESHRQTLENLGRTDWDENPILFKFSNGKETRPSQKPAHAAYHALKEALGRNADYFVVLEETHDFNKYFRHNLQSWHPLKTRSVNLAGLFNANARDLTCDVKKNLRVVDPDSLFGTQAFLIARPMADFLVKRWNHFDYPPAVKIARMAGRQGHPVFYHAPSLIQSIIRPDSSNLKKHPAKDFDRDWMAQ